MIIGITGGTGCGKTTLLRVIEAAGGLVLDCDRIYHELLRTDPSLLAAIEEEGVTRVEEQTDNFVTRDAGVEVKHLAVEHHLCGVALFGTLGLGEVLVGLARLEFDKASASG